MSEYMQLPAPRPCSDCPWRRNALPGWLGPHSAEEWIELAHSDSLIACHQTIPEGFDDMDLDADLSVMRQCRGAGEYRANQCKRPRNLAVTAVPAERENVFAGRAEFLDHHKRVRA